MTIDQESTVVGRREPAPMGDGEARPLLTNAMRIRDGRQPRTRGVIRRVVILVAAVTGIALLPISPALADPPDVDTVVRRDVTLSFPSSDPCTGAAGTFTLTVDIVAHFGFHGIEDDLAVFHAHQTQHGTFTFVPVDASLPSYSGRYVATFSLQATPPGEAYALTGTGTMMAKTENGTVNFHFRTHLTQLPSGKVVVNSFQATCR